MAMEMEVDEGCKVLPEDLVEKILAMVPYPYAYKARCLSKSWLSKFSSISSLDDKDERQSASSFQKQVAEWSNAWTTLCPVCVQKENAFGYDRTSNSWQRISLSFLPYKFLNRSNLRMKGALLYALPFHESQGCTRNERKLYIANILTQTWKEIPPYPDFDQLGRGFIAVYFQELVIGPSADSFKVIRFTIPWGVDVYDSKSDAWNTHLFVLPKTMYSSAIMKTAYLHGILYMMTSIDPRNLVAYNVEKPSLEVLDIGTFGGYGLMDMNSASVSSLDLVVCNGNLLMLLQLGLVHPTYVLLKIDLSSRELWPLACGPPANLNVFHLCTRPVSDGNCIFFGVETRMNYQDMNRRESRVLAYNMNKDDWICISVPAFFLVENKEKVYYNTRSRAKAKQLGVEEKKMIRRTDYEWISSPFQPGLSPFLAI